MPNVAATVHQLLRYFVVGVFTLFLWAFLLVPGAGKEPEVLHERAARVAKHLMAASSTGWAFATPFIVGVFMYSLHRVVLYPGLHRLVIWRVRSSPATTDAPWPYGRVTNVDANLQAVFWMPQGGAERERFVGWATEAHVLYVAVEIMLFSFVLWPGPSAWARVLDCWAFVFVAGSVAVGVATWAWDLQLVRLERRTAELVYRRQIV